MRIGKPMWSMVRIRGFRWAIEAVVTRDVGRVLTSAMVMVKPVFAIGGQTAAVTWFQL